MYFLCLGHISAADQGASGRKCISVGELPNYCIWDHLRATGIDEVCGSIWQAYQVTKVDVTREMVVPVRALAFIAASSYGT